MSKLVLGLMLLMSPAIASAQPLMGNPDLAILAKAPPKSRAKPVVKTAAAAPADTDGSGYDYFHLMAEPNMAPLRDAVASKPAKAATKSSPKPAAPSR